VAGRYGIRSIPTLILFRRGQEIDRAVGALDAARLRGWLQRHAA
jgi:thioredoxin 2